MVLWFGALFGLCSVAIRPGLIEHMVLVTGIDRVIPMAAPPLGTTTRILLALMMTAIGCLVGFVVARRLAKPAPQATARRRRASAVPIAADEGDSPVALFGAGRQDLPVDSADLEEEPESVPTIRRRQLAAIAQEERFDDHAPVPGALPILNVADLDLESFDAALEEEPWVRRSEPLQLDSAAEAKPIDAPELQAPERPGEKAASAERLFDVYTHAAPSRSVDEESAPRPGFDLLPREEDIVAAASAEAPAMEAPITPSPAMEAPEAPAVKDMTAAERIASAPLDALSPVELLERLALTIARRRAGQVHSAAQAPAEAPAMPATPVLELPAALRAVPTEAADDALPGYVPPRQIGRSDDDALAAGYSSLRNLTRPTLAPSAQDSETPAAKPVIAFPGAGDPDEDQPRPAAPRAFDAPGATSDRTEEALRAALATLQRMSGAA